MVKKQNVTSAPKYEVMQLKGDEIGVTAIPMNPKEERGAVPL